MPPWVPSNETKPAPMPLLVVQAFVNTFEADTDTDLLRQPGVALEWFVAAGLFDAGHALDPTDLDRADLDAADLDVARQARESVRALLAANANGTAPSEQDLEPLTAITRSCRLRLHVEPTGAVRVDTEPEGGLGAALLRLLLIIRDAQHDGTWQRLKACQNTECSWAFYDRSHSRRGMWCDMSVCGNRVKNRNLRTRQRHQPGARGGSVQD